jgi:hypothetical protein
MRTRKAIPALACLLLPLLAAAQPPHITIPSFADLKASAQDSVDITLGPPALGLLGWLADDSDTEGAQLKRALRGLKSVQIRNYEFKNGFTYPKADLDALRAQLSQPGWSQWVKVRNRDEKEDVDIYVALQNRTVEGVTVIACGLHELTVINLVGSVELDQVEGLRKMFEHPNDRLAQVSQRTP